MLENHRKGIASWALIALLSTSMVGCGSEKEQFSKLEGQEARTAFGQSSNIQLTGDIDDVNTFSDVIADLKNVGELKEHGLFDSRITYSVEGEDQFYVAFCDYDEDDKVVENEKYATSTTYTYYDMEGKRLGYAQDRALFKGDDEWYVMVFLDTEGNRVI